MKHIFMEMVAKVALRTAYSGQRKHSWWLTYQPQMPAQLKKLDK